MDKIRTIIDKEWAEVFKNRVVLYTVTFLPLMLTALPLIVLYSVVKSSGMDLGTAVPPQYAGIAKGLTAAEFSQVMIVKQFLALFLMIPVTLPVAIAAYSIVGEKTTRCLEPLLATPIETWELIAGKGLAAVLPAIAATWFGFGVFAIGARLLVTSGAVFTHIIDGAWLLAMLIVGPLMAVASVLLCEMVSSRVSDPRTAEQVSMVIIVPVLALFFGQLSGLFVINAPLVLAVAAALVAVNAGLVYLAVRLFQREAILTQWR
jgi:ABC-2 type transport system permease protein